jgi:hypothetical protein
VSWMGRPSEDSPAGKFGGFRKNGRAGGCGRDWKFQLQRTAVRGRKVSPVTPSQGSWGRGRVGTTKGSHPPRSVPGRPPDCVRPAAPRPAPASPLRCNVGDNGHFIGPNEPYRFRNTDGKLYGAPPDTTGESGIVCLDCIQRLREECRVGDGRLSVHYGWRENILTEGEKEFAKYQKDRAVKD